MANLQPGAESVDTLADLLEQLGDVSPKRMHDAVAKRLFPTSTRG